MFHAYGRYRTVIARLNVVRASERGSAGAGDALVEAVCVVAGAVSVRAVNNATDGRQTIGGLLTRYERECDNDSAKNGGGAVSHHLTYTTLAAFMLRYLA